MTELLSSWYIVLALEEGSKFRCDEEEYRESGIILERLVISMFGTGMMFFWVDETNLS